MSTKLVMRSIEKFFQDNIPEVYITRDSSRSDIYSFPAYNGVALSNTDVDIILNDGSGDYKTDENLVGWKVIYKSKTRNIVAHDNITSTITLDSTFGEDIDALSSMTITKDTWGYIKAPYPIDGKGKNFNREQKLRIYFYVKSKNDSLKDNLYEIVDKINSTIKEKFDVFPIYNLEETEIISEGDFSSTVSASELIEENEDLQSYVIDFQVSYRVSFIIL